MKNLLITALALFMLTSTQNVEAQATNIKVSGRHIIGTNGDTLRLYGVNYPINNWGWSVNENFFPEIKKSGASTVRIVWYAKSTLPAYSNIKYLDSAISRAIQHKMIPIVTLHDYTCQSIDSLPKLLPFYKSSAFLALEAKYRKHLILNVANEVGFYWWGGSSSALKTKYQTSYISFVDSVRKWGIKTPIMIDAPDGGSNSDVVVSVGNNILQADPQKNIIFGVHAYWYSFANNDSATMAGKVQSIHNSNLAYFFGEIASTQDGNSCGQYSLKYLSVMRILKSFNIGWTAWTWIGDCSAARSMTTNGNFTSLGTWGKAVVNDYAGIVKNAKTAQQFITLPVVSAPTVKSSALIVSNVTPTSMTLNFTKGNGANRIVVMKSTTAVTGVPVDGASYTANSSFGNGSILNAGEHVVYNGAGNSVNVTNLSAGSRYYFMVYEYNGSGSNNKYLKAGVNTNKFTLATEPTIKASAITFTAISQTGLTINFTKGNGSGRIIVMKAASAVTNAPTDGISYSPKAIFGTGSITGVNEYVVYTGTTSKAVITGLTKNTKYYIAIFECNGSSNTINYLTTGFSNNNVTSLSKMIEGEQQMEITTPDEDASVSEVFNIVENPLANIKCYPNPSMDGIITLEGATNAVSEVIVRSSEGKIISQSTFDIFGKNRLEVGSQPGIYFITITSNNNTYTHKVMRY